MAQRATKTAVIAHEKNNSKDETQTDRISLDPSTSEACAVRHRIRVVLLTTLCTVIVRGCITVTNSCPASLRSNTALFTTSKAQTTY